jgi:ATP-binding cassette, subfamily G (WHITE), member 2, PDR
LALLTNDSEDRWRNFGILWVYIIFNICGALFLYWLTRVPKDNKKEKAPAKSEQAAPSASPSAGEKA